MKLNKMNNRLPRTLTHLIIRVYELRIHFLKTARVHLFIQVDLSFCYCTVTEIGALQRGVNERRSERGRRCASSPEWATAASDTAQSRIREERRPTACRRPQWPDARYQRESILWYSKPLAVYFLSKKLEYIVFLCFHQTLTTLRVGGVPNTHSNTRV